MAGTQRVFRVPSLSVSQLSSISNNIAQLPGGVDITTTNSNALSISSTGVVALVYAQDPVVTGNYWGLRWLGTNHVAALTTLHTNVPTRLTWNDSQLGAAYQGQVGIYTDAVYTYVGLQVTNVTKSLSSGTVQLIVTTSGNGASSLGAGPSVSASLTAGASTQIVYTADEWCRIGALATNGVTATAASGARVFTQALPNVSANISNAVVFALTTPAQTGYTNVPTTWLTNWTEAAVQAALGRDGFSMHDKYLLGLDPTSSNTYRLAIDSLSVSGSNVVIVVKREVTGALSPDGMNGNLIVQGTPTLAGDGFTNIPATAVTGAAVFDGSERRTYTNAVGGAVRFYRAIVQ